MFTDITILGISLLAFIVAWILKMKVNWYTFLISILFAWAVFLLSPYFVQFAQHSTTDFPREYWYIFGAFMGMIVTLALWLWFRSTAKKQKLINRLLAASLFGILLFLAAGWFFSTLVEYQVLNMNDSQLIPIFLQWKLKF